MDPLSALSVAGTIVQFVDFSSRVLSRTHELYRSSEALSVNQDLDLVSADLFQLSQRLSTPIRGATTLSPATASMTEDEKLLQKLCSVCSEISVELSTRLSSLRVRGEQKKWESFRQAVKSVWSERDIQELMRRLSTVRDAVQAHVVAGLRNQIGKMALDQAKSFQTLDQKTQQIVTALLSREGTAEAQMVAITQLLGRVELIAEDQLLTAKALQAIEYAEQNQQTPKARGEPTPLSERLHKEFELSESHVRSQAAENILRSLRFPAIADRKEAIAEAHQRTFSWIFEEGASAEKALWSSFADWLRYGTGVYWITGKAASGKSTLMKYIHESPNTKRLLWEWSAHLPLVTARFYFWVSGTAEQRSQSGLLRTLLFEVLTQNKNLIPVVLPLHWARAYSELVGPFRYHYASYTASDEWTIRELMDGFQALAKQESVLLKLCLFIDGLDEYEGDYAKIADLFRGIAKSPRLKVCLSSRPLLVFEDAFRSIPFLRLQDLTYGDIKSYVTSHFNCNEHFDRLQKKEPIRAPELIEDIVARADGVFLWVKLVVISLLEGLGNRDEVPDLQRRLELIPVDLEDLFNSMLAKIGSFYLDKAAEIFQIIRASHRITESMEVYPSQLMPLDTLSLSFAVNPEPDLVFNPHPQAISEIDRQERREKIRDQLKVWCAGLLETGMAPRSQDTVRYLHRTVRDYLDRPENLGRLVSRTAKTDFEPNTVMLQSLIVQLRLIDSPGLLEYDDRVRFPTTALMYAHQAEEDAKRLNAELLDQFFKLMKDLYSRGWNPFYGHGNWGIQGVLGDGYLPVAVEWDLLSFVENSFLKTRTKLAKGAGRPLLHYAIGFAEFDFDDEGRDYLDRFRKFGRVYPPRPRMVSLLLRHGSKPQAPFRGLSAWRVAISNALDGSAALEKHGYSEWWRVMLAWKLEIIKIMLEYGADPSICFWVDREFKTARRLLNEALLDRWPVKAAELDRTFETYGGKHRPSKYQKLGFRLRGVG
ncbi:MAG: hypothetical protein M1840_001185 [Geoglossum simile]|nr:MAG: hypothetical protein M1840_001185 [Geoglossum simile]